MRGKGGEKQKTIKKLTNKNKKKFTKKKEKEHKK